MKLKSYFMIIWFLFILLVALPVRAQDKYKVYLTNGRSIACVKYWYEGDKILLATATDITFGFDKKEVVKIEGLEAIGVGPAGPPKTLPASPSVSPPAVAEKPLTPSLPLPASAYPSSPASPKPNMFPGLPPGMESVPPGPWLPQASPPAGAAPSQPYGPPAGATPSQPITPPATVTPPLPAKPPAAAIEEKSPPEEPEIIMDDVQEEKEVPEPEQEPMEPPEEN